MQQPFVNGGNILLVATDAIERLGYDIVNLPVFAALRRACMRGRFRMLPPLME